MASRSLFCSVTAYVGGLAAIYTLSTPVFSEGNAAKVIDEIEVIGRKKSTTEAIQEVPIAISAFSAEQIEAKAVYNLEGLSFMMPNVTLDDIGTANGIANFSIRGLGINSTIPSIDPTVGVFVDGVYLGITYGVIYDFFDVDGIEVLRGPQSTLFGRNVTGGAVLVKNARPTEEFTSKIKLGVESGPQGVTNKTAAATVSGTLVDDKLLGKLTIYQRDNNGWHQNLATGETFGEEDASLIRVSSTWLPGSKNKVWLSYEQGKIDGQGPAAQNRAFYNKNSFDFAVGTEGFAENEWKSAVIEYNHDVNFGNGTITNIVGWRDYSLYGQSDLDGQVPVLFDANFKTFQDQLSNELRYAGTFSDIVDVTVGLYWFGQNIDYFENRVLSSFGVNATMGGTQDQSTKAIFGQMDYAIKPNHIVTLGLRYTEEEKAVKVATFNPAPTMSRCNLANESCDYDFIDDHDWSYGSYKIGYQWIASEDLQLYTSLSTGDRAGGYNLRSTNLLIAPGPFDEETSRSVEVGIKTDLLNGRMRSNLALYQNRIDDLQREINVPSAAGITQKIVNAADATINGIELEFQALLTNNLSLNAAVGMMDGKYRTVREDLNRDGVIDQQDKDLEMPRLAPWSMSTGIIYDIFLNNIGMVTTALNYAYRDESYFTDDNKGRLNNANMIDASVAYTTSSEQLRISLYGKNLKNEPVNGSDAQLPFGADQTFSPLNEGRTLGVDVIYKF